MITQGTALGGSIVAKSAVPAGHKVSVKSIKSGEPILAVRQIIGFATKDIEPGFHVHLQNMALGEFDKDYAFGAIYRDVRRVARRSRTARLPS
ncbi:SAF domain-containing protein [Mesorhizobium sp. M1348]